MKKHTFISHRIPYHTPTKKILVVLERYDKNTYLGNATQRDTAQQNAGRVFSLSVSFIVRGNRVGIDIPLRIITQGNIFSS